MATPGAWEKTNQLCQQKQKIKKQKNMEVRKMERIRNFFKDESGATMVEYGLMVALIAIACIGAVNLLSGGVQTVFNSAGNTLDAAS